MQIKSLGMASEIQVYDNFLNGKELDEINFNLFRKNSNFVWFFNSYKTNVDGVPDELPQFTHFLYHNGKIHSEYYNIFDCLFKKLNVLSFIKIKLNLQIKDCEIQKSGLHRDVEVRSQDQKTGIFYLNSNNGYTFFESGEKIDSVKNRMVIFPTSLYHAGTTHTDTQYRCVLNMNWI